MKSFASTIDGAAPRRLRLTYIMSTTALSTAIAITAAPVLAQIAKPQNASDQSVEEVVVTGSRIIREGYEAPTPLTVFGQEQMQQNATPNLMTLLNDVPALSGNMLTTSNIVTQQGQLGNQNPNLRNLGANRVLVLLDGQRTVGSSLAGVPDVGTFPQQLISRVDVVTGGASAVYGSDAVAGVINFVLDRMFTGVKGEISGGVTNYGDDKNYKIDLSAGIGFADNRGHILLSGEHMHNGGIIGPHGRDWDHRGVTQLTNPSYTATNGQPQQLFATDNSGIANLTPGGIITSGPLKGTAFGAGGTPFKYNYGPIYANPNMIGGDWRISDMRVNNDVDPRQTIDNIFTRISYDITDNLNAYIQYGYSQMTAYTNLNTVWIVGGSPQGLTLRTDNAYLPASVKAAAAAAGVTNFQLGTWNLDAGFVGNDNLYITNRLIGGFEGKFDAFDTSWKWNANYAYGTTMMKAIVFGILVQSRYRNATDAVVNPATGQIVCRVTLTNPADPCRPWNVFGVGVNDANSAAKAYMQVPSFQRGLIKQDTFAASITGEPFSLWAGAVGVALSFEHRLDDINVANDPFSQIQDRPFGIVPGLVGKQSVTEGALEAIIPLAKGENWAQAWDLNLAARFTGYEVSGFVTTYKVGTTYAPVDDIKFRFTYSRDIRAPNLQELFASTNAGGGNANVTDPFLKTSYPIGLTLQKSNPNLTPEIANTIGVGAVLSPKFLEGFTASVDYWDVNVDGAIQQLLPQQVIDSCYSGQHAELCPDIARAANGNIDVVTVRPINLATKDVRGLDLEASYRMPISNLVSEWGGTFSIHGLMTFYFRNYEDTKFIPPTNHVGENSGSTAPPNWKADVSMTYSLDPITFTLTGRAVSGGVINHEYIECKSGCPTSTAQHTTIDNNQIPGRAYLDANITYKLAVGESTTDLYLSVKNMFNNNPPPAPASFFYGVANISPLYDRLGAVYRAGVRFKM